jgi:hypothetical protein
MADIISEYERKKDKNGNLTTSNRDIIPLKYNEIASIIKNPEIENLIFVYESALRVFLHSLEYSEPVIYNKLPQLNFKDDKHKFGLYKTIKLNEKNINLILLQNPLNRSRQLGLTLSVKRDLYKMYLVK